MPTDADLAAVVLDVPGGDAARLGEALRRSDRRLEIVVVRPGESPGADALNVFPLGTCYARNRGAARAQAPLLLFLDSDARALDDVAAVRAALEGSAAALLPHGAMAFRRLYFARAGGFDHALGLGTSRRGPHDAELMLRLGATNVRFGRFDRADAVAAGRTARRHRSPALAARALLGGGLKGLLGRAQWEPPSASPYLPDELRHLAPLQPLAAASPAKTHFLYSTTGRVVHLYVNAGERVERSLAEREQIRARAGRGVPVLEAVVPANDCLWIVEERLPGRPPPASQASAWFPLVREWALRLVDPERKPLAEAPLWRRHRDDLLRSSPSSLRPALQRALEIVGRLPAAGMHGDLQRKNLLLSGTSIGVVDWEGAWLEGIPGLDLVYLALVAESDAPDPAILDRLAAGDDVESFGLREALSESGVARASLHAGLLVMLATWARAEQRRRERLGAAPTPPVFGPLLETRGRRLAAAIL